MSDNDDQQGLFDRMGPLPVTRDTEAMKRRREEETRGKEEALELLEEHRAWLIAAGKAVARSIAAMRGRVTATEVLATLRNDPRYAAAVAGCDPRWTGCLFRGKDWVHIGEEREGSHRRTVWIWGLKTCGHNQTEVTA